MNGSLGRLGYRLSQASAIVKSAAFWSCVGAVHGKLESHSLVSVVALLCSGWRTTGAERGELTLSSKWGSVDTTKSPRSARGLGDELKYIVSTATSSKHSVH